MVVSNGAIVGIVIAAVIGCIVGGYCIYKISQADNSSEPYGGPSQASVRRRENEESAAAAAGAAKEQSESGGEER